MSTIDFCLDFTKYVPKGFLPDHRKATSAFVQTIKHYPHDIIFRQTNKQGYFVIHTKTKADAQKLEGQKVIYEYGPNNKHSAMVRLERLPTYQFRTNAKNVYIDWTFDSGLRYATSDDFDVWLSDYVTIISPTTDDKDRETGFKNGRKRAYVDFNQKKEIPRFVTLEIEVTLPDSSKEIAKENLKITYKDQPIYCRVCKAEHVGMCPIRQKEIEEIKAAEIERAPSIKTPFFGDSNLRHIDQLGTTATVHSATDAKIGHVANALKFEEVEKFENILIHVGQNNIIDENKINFAQWENQIRSEITHLTQQLQRGKGNTKIIEVPESLAATVSPQAKKMRNLINEELKGVVNILDNAEYITVNAEVGDDEDAWTDYRHYSQVMCGKLLEAIDTTFPESNKFIRRGKNSTTPRKYSRVNASYRLGCGSCTVMGHLEETCTKTTGVKRPNISGTALLHHKKDKFNLSTLMIDFRI